MLTQALAKLWLGAQAYRGLIGFVSPNSTSTLPLLQTLVLCFRILIPEKASAERRKKHYAGFIP